jgi:hypothetical protein
MPGLFSLFDLIILINDWILKSGYKIFLQIDERK